MPTQSAPRGIDAVVLNCWSPGLGLQVEEKLQSDSTRMTNEVKELTNSVSALTGTVDSKTAEVDQLNKDIACLRSDLDAKTTEFSDLKIANEGVVAERDALNKQVDKSKQEFTKQSQGVADGGVDEKRGRGQRQAVGGHGPAAQEGRNQERVPAATACQSSTTVSLTPPLLRAMTPWLTAATCRQGC